jgi:hypothetical protein
MCGCQEQPSQNNFIFPANRLGWYAIVNGVAGGEIPVQEGGLRYFIFPESKVLLLNTKAIAPTPLDSFFTDAEGVRTWFNRDSAEFGRPQVCYYTASLNSGYNPEYYGGQESATPGRVLTKTFDFYLFHIDTICNPDTNDLDSWVEEVYRLLEAGRHNPASADASSNH